MDTGTNSRVACAALALLGSAALVLLGGPAAFGARDRGPVPPPRSSAPAPPADSQPSPPTETTPPPADATPPPGPDSPVPERPPVVATEVAPPSQGVEASGPGGPVPAAAPAPAAAKGPGGPARGLARTDLGNTIVATSGAMAVIVGTKIYSRTKPRRSRSRFARAR